MRNMDSQSARRVKACKITILYECNPSQGIEWLAEAGIQ